MRISAPFPTLFAPFATLFATLLLVSLLGALPRPAPAAPSLLGTWYGLRDGAPTTLEFREDGTARLKVEGNSMVSSTCQFRVNYAASPVTVDLVGLVPKPLNMDCAAIAQFHGDSEMELFGNLGPPAGKAQRPKQIERDLSGLTILSLKLSRDPKAAQLPTPETAPVPASASLAFQRNKRLGRGLNLAGVFDAQEVEPINPEYIPMIRAAGFTNVRLPVRWSAHCARQAPYTIAPAFFEQVDRVVKQCLDAGLAVALDLHYYPGISYAGDSDSLTASENLDRFGALWEQIAAHYRSSPPEVYFSLLNEPRSVLGAAGWNRLVARTLKTIRKTNPGRTVLVAPPDGGQCTTIGLLELPQDDWNLIVEVHYYFPYAVTLQGASWEPGADAWRGTRWTGTPGERAAVEGDLGYSADWGRRHHRPVHLGEFGSVTEADVGTRARWTGFVRQTAEKEGMSFAAWSFSRVGFDVFDEEAGRWIEPLRAALAPGK